VTSGGHAPLQVVSTAVSPRIRHSASECAEDLAPRGLEQPAPLALEGDAGLVAKPFAEHYAPIHLDANTAVADAFHAEHLIGDVSAMRSTGARTVGIFAAGVRATAAAAPGEVQSSAS
jgi:hypothetical protein